MRNNRETKLENELKNKIMNLLSQIPFLKIRKKPIPKSRIQPDLILNVNDGTRSSVIIIEIKASGEPRYARSAMLQLKEYMAGIKKSYGIFAAPYISKDTANICKENKIGYIDKAGNCFINFAKVFIERENCPNPNKENRIIRSIFSPKSSRVLRIMLCDPKKQWQIQEIVKESEISIGLAFKVKERLLDLEYIQENDDGVSLKRPQELLDIWSENYSYNNNTFFNCFTNKNLKEFEKEFASLCKKKQLNYALSLFSGASLVAPFSRYIRGFAYIDNDAIGILDDLEAKEVDSGANFTFMKPYDDGIFYNIQKINGMNIVNNIQLYLDLKSYKGRGDEAAQFLLEQKIKKKW